LHETPKPTVEPWLPSKAWLRIDLNLNV